MRYLLLSLLMLTGCATTRQGPPEIYGNLDPCMIVKGKHICLEAATPREVAEWNQFHLEPVIDSTEEAALQWWKWGSAADVGTTTAAMALCKGVAREANPLFAGLGPVGFVAVNGTITYWVYVMHKRMAERTSRYEGSVLSAFGGKVRAGAGVNNAFVLSQCI